MTASVGQKFVTVVLGGFILLAFVGFLSFNSIRNLIAVSKLVDETDALVGDLKNLSYSLKSAQNAQNEYLLTGKERYLESYQGTVRKIETQLEALAKSEFHPLIEGPDGIRVRVAGALKEFERIIDVRREDGLNSALQLVFTGRARNVMVAVGVLLAELQIKKENLLDNQNAEAHLQEKATIGAIAVAVGVGLVLLLVATGVILRDLHRRDRMQRELEAAREVAIQASAMKSSFLANMSHEIRTPLNAVIGMSGLLSETKMTADQSIFSETIQISSRILLGLINDILDISKIEAGKLDLEDLDFDIRTITGEVEKMFVLKAAEKQLALKFEYVPGTQNYLSADKNRLRQILTNLLSNSMKFTEKGSISVKLRSESLPTGRIKFCVDVTDTGIGIPLKVQSQIFGSFNQGDSSTTRKFGGTGLGLAVSRELSRKMGGDLTFRSVPGESTTFSLFITCDVAKAAVAPEPPIGSSLGLTNPENLHLLVAEDNPFNQQLMRQFFKKAGVPIDIAGSGRDVLKKMETGTYDAILMDCQMPDMDGYETSRAIREKEAGTKIRTPIIALTADAMAGVRQRCLDAGMDDFVTKPIDFAILEKAIAHYVRGAGQKPGPEKKKTTSVAGRSATVNPVAPTEVPSVTPAVFDASVVLELQNHQMAGETDLVLEMIDLFFQTAEARLPIMRDAFKTEKTSLAIPEAHVMKSCSGQIGARALYKECELLEELLKEKKEKQAAQCMARIESSYRQLKVEISNFRESYLPKVSKAV